MSYCSAKDPVASLTKMTWVGDVLLVLKQFPTPLYQAVDFHLNKRYSQSILRGVALCWFHKCPHVMDIPDIISQGCHFFWPHMSHPSKQFTSHSRTQNNEMHSGTRNTHKEPEHPTDSAPGLVVLFRCVVSKPLMDVRVAWENGYKYVYRYEIHPENKVDFRDFSDPGALLWPWGSSQRRQTDSC